MSRPNLSFALEIQNAADEPPGPAPMIAMRFGMGASAGTGRAMSGAWEPEEKKGSWMLNGSWNAYVGKNAAVVTRNTTGDRILGC